MTDLLEFLAGQGKADECTTMGWADHVQMEVKWRVYPRSLTARDQTLLFLGRKEWVKTLGLLYQGESKVADAFEGETTVLPMHGQPATLKTCPLNHANAVALRQMLPYTGPRVVGLATSAGCGDRLGLATPGHIRAVRGTGLVPFFAQQSIREMERSGRTPEDVMDDATWAVFQEGWREGFGSDADHLKTHHDIDICVAAGFTLFTIDPREHVDNDAHTDSETTLKAKFDKLPWDDLETTPKAMLATYAGRSFPLEGKLVITLSESQVWRAAAKYGRAIVHVVHMGRYLARAMGTRPFELEVSVDETDTPTAPHEHFFVASELKRMGLHWVSLAPRYLGAFEKGVDYIGDLKLFDEDLAWHAAIARKLGPYKLSIHSGSDKFSIYPIFAKHCGPLVHLKTAGTSYLEALRAIASLEPHLFREILGFAFDHYETDKASYHVSADLAKVPKPEDLRDGELAGVLDNFDGRQLLHVTFGSVLTEKNEAGAYRFRNRLLSALDGDEEAYYDIIEAHFDRHLAPF